MITFTRSWRGYAAGTSVSTLADTIEALAVAEGAATYGGVSYPPNSYLDADNRTQALVDPAGIPRQFGQVAAATCALLGDSRNDQHSNGPIISAGNARTKTAVHWLNWYNALNNQPLKVTSKYAVSGSQTSALDGQITSTLAVSPLPQFAFIWSGINDLVNLVSAATAAANMAAACARLAGYGITPVVFLDTGSTGLNNSAKLQSLFEYNQRLRDMADADRRILLFDPTATVWDATSATWTSTPTVAFKSGMSSDGTHLTNLGGYNTGVAFGVWFAGRVAPFDTRIATQGEMVNANNPLAYIINPLFTTTSGGSVAGAGGLTGNVPGSWTYNKGAVASTATTITTPAGAYGNDLTLAITTAAADYTRLSQDVATGVRTGTPVGAILQGGFEISISSGVNFTGVNVRHEYNDGSNTYTFYDMFCQNAGAGDGPQAFTIQSAPFPMEITTTPSGWITTRVDFVFSGAGSVNAVVRRASLRRRYSA